MSLPSPADAAAATSEPQPAPKCRDIPEEFQAEWMRQQKERDRIRAELRIRMWYEILQLTGVSDPFGMRWTDKSFLKNIVGKLHCGVFGWPPEIPFQNLSDISKTAPLEKLLRLWGEGTLRIAKLSDEERAQAAVDPKSFLPNPTLRAPPKPKSKNVVRVVPLVFHPVDLHELSQPSGGSRSSSSPLTLTTTARPAKRKRKQRSDTKLARKKKTHYGRGVKSREYVYDTESDGEFDPDVKRFREALSDDRIEEFPEAAVVEDVEDDISEFTEAEPDPEDDIESATESWMLGEDTDADNVE